MKIVNKFLIMQSALRILRAEAGNCGLKSDKSPLIPGDVEVSASQTILRQ